MKIVDLMSRDVEFIAATAPVREAAELMGELDVGALPIGGPDDLRGIVTDRDLLYRVIARGLDPATTTVGSVQSTPVVSCQEDDAVQLALDIMAANHIRRLAVRGAGGAVTGWITLADLARGMLLNGSGGDALQTALRTLTEDATPPARAEPVVAGT